MNESQHPPVAVVAGETSLSLKPDDIGFNLVYQGGHHDVWCNGTEHRYCSGGWAGKWPRIFTYNGPCNCASFSPWRGPG